MNPSLAGKNLASVTLRPSKLAKSTVLVLSFSFLAALSAQIVIPLPMTPVPLTGQTLVVLLAGAVLGSRLGFVAMTLYLIEGAVGFPVFKSGGAGLPYLLFSPTAGYLLTYPAAAYVVGFLSERGWNRHFLMSACAMALGSALILIGGGAWLAAISGAPAGFRLGILPFIPGEMLKVAIGAGALPKAWYLFGVRGRRHRP